MVCLVGIVQGTLDIVHDFILKAILDEHFFLISECRIALRHFKYALLSFEFDNKDYWHLVFGLFASSKAMGNLKAFART